MLNFAHHSFKYAFKTFFERPGRLVLFCDPGRFLLRDHSFVQILGCIQLRLLLLLLRSSSSKRRLNSSLLHELKSFLSQILTNVFEPLLLVAKVQSLTVEDDVLELFNGSLMS